MKLGFLPTYCTSNFAFFVFTKHLTIILFLLSNDQCQILVLVNALIFCAFQVFENELEKYEQARKKLQGFAIQIMSTGPTAPYSEQVLKDYNVINHRWEGLCKELGISFKRVEETVFSLRLLEAVLTKLNEWLKSIEGKVRKLSLQLTEPDDNTQRLLDLKVPDYSVTSFYYIYLNVNTWIS